MNTERVQGIIVAKPSLDLVAKEERNEASGDANKQRASWSHKTAGRGNDNQSSDCPRTETKYARLAFEHPFRHGPDKGSNGGRQCGGCEGVRGHAIRSDSAASIKSVPTDPQHAGANHAEHQVVRRHVLF